MIKLYKTLLIISACFIHTQAFTQDDLLSLADDNTAPKNEKVIATFKGFKVINAQSTETVKAKTLDFCVAHRFGNIGTQSGGGGHTLYGLDNSADIRISFAYGITDNITIGVGRSKEKELIDGLIKYRFLTQTTNNKIPVSVAFYGNMSYNPQDANQFYAGTAQNANFKQNDIYRFAYTSQLIIARKFGSRFSMEILPTYQHRNFVLGNINPDNGAEETNDLFAIGAAARLKLTKRVCLIVDYFHSFSKYRTNNPVTPFYNPLALGIEIETGGHVFHLNFTNSAGIIENNFIPNTTDSWLKGGFKFGFNISRVFNIGKPKK
ncbi:MAG: hypothetical protein JNL69_09570 [Bacteroidia bacterium]|nr:hypothetical protein [Bacteroidia bacterium]